MREAELNHCVVGSHRVLRVEDISTYNVKYVQREG